MSHSLNFHSTSTGYWQRREGVVFRKALNWLNFTQTSGTGHAWGRFSQCEAHSVLSFLWKGTALKVWKQTNTRVRNEHHRMPRSRLFLCISHIVIVRFCILYFMSTLAGVTRDLFHMSPLPVNDTTFFLFFSQFLLACEGFLVTLLLIKTCN